MWQRTGKNTDPPQVSRWPKQNPDEAGSQLIALPKPTLSFIGATNGMVLIFILGMWQILSW